MRYLQIHRIICTAIIISFYSSGYTAALEVTHQPKSGQFESINAALKKAKPGETITIIDNSAPYTEVILISKENITLRADSSLDKPPIITAGIENEVVLDCKSAGSTFENITIFANTNQIGFRTEKDAALLNCTIKGGIYSFEQQAGTISLTNCNIGSDSIKSACLIRSGKTRFNKCTMTSPGVSLTIQTDKPQLTEVICEFSVIKAQPSEKGLGSLIVLNPGTHPDQKRRLLIDNCDLIGKGQNAGGGKEGWHIGGGIYYYGPADVTVIDTIFYDLGYPFLLIQANNQPEGYLLNEDYCLYQKTTINVPLFLRKGSLMNLLGNNSKIVIEPIYVNPEARDYRLFKDSPPTKINSTGTPSYAGSQGVSDLAADCGDWQRVETTILSGFNNMYNCHIIEESEDPYRYKMYFFGWAANTCNSGYSGCDAIFLARSKDLVHWQVYCGDNSLWDGTGNAELWVPVITADNKFYDQWHNGDPSVVKHNGTYYMAYSATGFDADGVPEGLPSDTDAYISVVMGAFSTDGIHWQRSAAPLLMCGDEIGRHESQRAADYYGVFHRPSLMLDEGKWRLWFDYWHPKPNACSMGLAECPSGADPMNPDSWTIVHPLSKPLLINWPNPDIIKVDGTYYSFSDPSGYPGAKGWSSRQIREARSIDGLNWVVLDFIPPDSDTPSCHVPEAFLTTINGQKWMYLFYACQIGGDPYDYRYDRVRAMRREIQK